MLREETWTPAIIYENKNDFLPCELWHILSSLICSALVSQED
jgi:hypothetical protein